MQLPSVAWTEP